MSIESVMPSNHLILCRPLLLLSSIFPNIRVFSNESVLHIRWPKYWRFSFNISPSNVYSGLISFRMDWLDLLAVQGTLRSLLQHHSSKASIQMSSSPLYLWHVHESWESSQLRDRTHISHISCIGSRFFTTSATWDAPAFPLESAFNIFSSSSYLSINISISLIHKPLCTQRVSAIGIPHGI